LSCSRLVHFLLQGLPRRCRLLYIGTLIYDQVSPRKPIRFALNGSASNQMDTDTYSLTSISVAYITSTHFTNIYSTNLTPVYQHPFHSHPFHSRLYYQDPFMNTLSLTTVLTRTFSHRHIPLPHHIQHTQKRYYVTIQTKTHKSTSTPKM
jgi:hypothetical protein